MKNRSAPLWGVVCACLFSAASCANVPSDSQETSTQSSFDASTPVVTQVVEDLAVVEAATGESSAQVGNADVLFVKAVQDGDGSWTFSVTVHHPDTGWDDYADGWDVVTEDGLVLKHSNEDPFTRLLLHPHENEQPFTRSQGGIVIPEGVTRVTVRAHDLVDGFGGSEVAANSLLDSGPKFEVVRN